MERVMIKNRWIINRIWEYYENGFGFQFVHKIQRNFIDAWEKTNFFYCNGMAECHLRRFFFVIRIFPIIFACHLVFFIQMKFLETVRNIINKVICTTSNLITNQPSLCIVWKKNWFSTQLNVNWLQWCSFSYSLRL